jgi:tetratricopeptide (TPR) repeat protein
MTVLGEDVAAIIGLINSGEATEALALADRLIELRGDDAQLHFVKAEALRHLGDLAAAESLLTAIHRDAPENAEVLFRLGLARLDQGNVEGALEAFDGAAQREPDHAGAWLHAGRCLFLLGNLTDAERALRRAVELDPQGQTGLIHLAICLARQRVSDEGLAVSEERLLQEPELEDLAGAIVNVYIANNLNESAILVAQAMAAANPAAVIWPETLGSLMNIECRYEEAARYCRLALELEPDSPRVTYHLAMALRNLGRTDDATDIMRRAVELAPLSVDANMGLAGLYLDTGRSAEAAQAVAEFDRAAGNTAPVKRSVVIAVLDYSPGSSFNIVTLLDDLKSFDGEVICVFNGDEVFEQLRDHPRIDKFSYNKFNVGVSRGWNIGINQAEGETIHILNADLHISVDMLYRMEGWVHRLPDAVCVGVTAHWMDFANMKETRVLNAGQFSEPMETDAVSGQIFTFHAARLHDAGLSFDPRLAPYFGEETDLAFKVKRSGYKIYAVPENDFEHQWGISRYDRPIYCFGRQVNRVNCMVRNRLLLRRKIDAQLEGTARE